MQHLLCQACSAGKKAGVTTTPARYSGRFCGPEETVRVTFGIAKQPQEAQRVIRVNGKPFKLALTAYNCDRCNAEIHHGERCAAETAWSAEQPPLPMWEAEYMEAE